MPKLSINPDTLGIELREIYWPSQEGKKSKQPPRVDLYSGTTVIATFFNARIDYMENKPYVVKGKNEIVALFEEGIKVVHALHTTK